MLLMILVGHILIATFVRTMFNIEPLSIQDWMLILLLTAPVIGDVAD